MMGGGGGGSSVGLGIGWGEMRLVQGGQVRVSGVVRMVGVGVWVG